MNEYYIFSIIFNGLFVLKNPLNPIMVYNIYKPIKYPLILYPTTTF